MKACPCCEKKPEVQDAQTMFGDVWKIVCYRCNIHTEELPSYREVVRAWDLLVEKFEQ